MKELLLTKQQAEKVLAENEGDMTKALKALLIPSKKDVGSTS
jgi:HYPK UBA domain